MVLSNSGSILVIGEFLEDREKHHEEVRRMKGGAAANLAFRLSQLGQQVTLVSAVGDDSLGKEMLEYLSSNGMDTTFVQQLQGEVTGVVDVYRAGDGKTHYVIHPAAWEKCRLQSGLLEAASQASVLCINTLFQRGPLSRELLWQLVEVSQGKVVLDVNIRVPPPSKDTLERSFRSSHIVKIADDEAGDVAEICEIPFHGYQSLVVSLFGRYENIDGIAVTLRDKGSEYFNRFGKTWYQPGFYITEEELEAGDTVGCGDSWLAGFLSRCNGEESIPDALSYGNLIGAVNARKESGMTVFPDEEIREVGNRPRIYR